MNIPSLQVAHSLYMHSRKSGLCFIVSFFDLRNAPTVIMEITVGRTDASLINMSFFQGIKTGAK